MSAERHFRIVDYAPRYKADFARLNVEWLEQYFRVEPVDRTMLEDPEGQILEYGGAIVFALEDGVGQEPAVGTCALKHHGARRYELTKMGVTAQCQGHGLGRRLAVEIIARFHHLQGRELYLESHHSLAAALALYESLGFTHQPRPPGLDIYERSDIYMVYEPDSP